MTDDRTGWPVYPHVVEYMEHAESGMTLRDYFAGQVLPAVYEECTETSPSTECETWSQMVAREAFDIADDMIAARATAALAALKGGDA